MLKYMKLNVIMQTTIGFLPVRTVSHVPGVDIEQKKGHTQKQSGLSTTTGARNIGKPNTNSCGSHPIRCDFSFSNSDNTVQLDCFMF